MAQLVGVLPCSGKVASSISVSAYTQVVGLIPSMWLGVGGWSKSGHKQSMLWKQMGDN